MHAGEEAALWGQVTDEPAAAFSCFRPLFWPSRRHSGRSSEFKEFPPASISEGEFIRVDALRRRVSRTHGQVYPKFSNRILMLLREQTKWQTESSSKYDHGIRTAMIVFCRESISWASSIFFCFALFSSSSSFTCESKVCHHVAGKKLHCPGRERVAQGTPDGTTGLLLEHL